MLRRPSAIVVVAFVLLGESTPVGATAPRTFVASKGNDANPCTLALPCRGFNAAVAQTATGGEVIVLDSAGYGTVTIAKSVSLIAPPGIYAGILVSSSDGITIDGAGVHVLLRGVAINGVSGSSTDGIEFIQGDKLTVEDCEIAGMGANGIEVATGSTIVRNTVLRENGMAGFYAVGSNVFATLSGVRSERNAVGARANFGADITIVDSVLTRNAMGVHVLASSSSWSKAKLAHSVLIGDLGASGPLGVYLETTPGSLVTVVLDGNSMFDFGFAVYFSKKGGIENVYSRQNNTLRTQTVTNGTLTPEPAY